MSGSMVKREYLKLTDNNNYYYLQDAISKIYRTCDTAVFASMLITENIWNDLNGKRFKM